MQFDSHPDTWDAYFGQRHTHGTPFRRAVEEGLLEPSRSIQVGMRGSIYDKDDWDDAREMGFDLVPTDEVRELGILNVIDRIRERVGDANLRLLRRRLRRPRVRAGDGHAGDRRLSPAARRRSSREASPVSRSSAATSSRSIPSYDPAQITALLAANIAHEFLSLFAFSK